MKILFLSMEYPPETGWGGIGTYVKSIASALADRGHQVHVLSCVRGQQWSDYLDGPVFVHRRNLKGVRGLGRVLRAPAAANRLNSALSCWLSYRELGVSFDVVEIPDWMGEGLMLGLTGSKPIVAHLHSPLRVLAKHRKRSLGWDGFLSDRIERMAVQKAQVITSSSQLLVSELKTEGWLLEDPVIVRDPAESKYWATLPPPGDTDPVLLFVGRLEPLKAPEVLLEAAARLQDGVSGLRVDFVGQSAAVRDGVAYVDWLRQRAAELGVECRFPGHVRRDDLRTWFAGARVVVVPSLYESFSMAGLEGMASGRPLVCTTSTGIAEIVAGSQGGKVVPPGDVDALAAAIRPYLLDASYASEAGAKARDVVIRNCGPERIAEEREASYLTAAARWRRLRVLQSRGLPHAAPRVGRLSPIWRRWAVEEAVVTPWKHFYLRTAEHLFDLLGAHHQFADRESLSGIRVLDLAATPAVSALLSCLGADVVLLDIAKSEMDKVKPLREALDTGSHLFGLRADAFRVPLRPASFDLVWSSGFIEHFDDPRPIVETMVSLVRPGGAVCILVPSRWTPHTLFVRGLMRRRRSGFYWDWVGRERSYTQADVAGFLQGAGARVLKTSAFNLRRSIVDDSVVLPRLDYPVLRKFLYAAMNGLDWIENRFAPVQKIGFMVGAVGEVP